MRWSWSIGSAIRRSEGGCPGASSSGCVTGEVAPCGGSFPARPTTIATHSPASFRTAPPLAPGAVEASISTMSPEYGKSTRSPRPATWPKVICGRVTLTFEITATHEPGAMDWGEAWRRGWSAGPSTEKSATLDWRSTPRISARRFDPSPTSTLKIPPGIAMLAVASSRCGLRTTAVPIKRRTGRSEWSRESLAGTATRVMTLVRAESTPIRSAASSDLRGRMLVAREEEANDSEHAKTAKERRRRRRTRIKSNGHPKALGASLEDDVDAVALSLIDGHDGGILSLGAALEVKRVVDDLVVVTRPIDPAVHDRVAAGRVLLRRRRDDRARPLARSGAGRGSRLDQGRRGGRDSGARSGPTRRGFRGRRLGARHDRGIHRGRMQEALAER